jgi:hypothetical protein
MNARKLFGYGVLASLALAQLTPPAAGAGPSAPAWLPINSPSPSPLGNRIEAIAAIAPGSVLAVGTSTSSTSRPLAVGWNGTQWMELPAMPTPVAQDTYLTGVAGTAGGPLVVGYLGQDTSLPPAQQQPTTLITRLAAGAWSTASEYEVTGVLTDVASTQDGACAVGYTSLTAGASPQRALVVCDGPRGWAAQPLPPMEEPSQRLDAIASAPNGALVAVGRVSLVDGRERPLVLWREHGGEWQRMAVPDPPDAGAVLLGVAVPADPGFWKGTPQLVAVGYRYESVHDAGTDAAWRPLALRLADGAWSELPVPNVKGTQLHGAVTPAGEDTWVVGYELTPAGEQAHIERCNSLGCVRETAANPPPGQVTTNDEVASALSAVAAAPGGGPLWTGGWRGGPGQAGAQTNLLLRAKP